VASTLATAELPAHERGASVAPSRPDILARLRRLSLDVGELHAALERCDLTDAQRILVASGLARIGAGIEQTASAAGLVRTGGR
jgi:hypothetical protein